ncbi:GNAT family N-acetyltransferase [Acetanaerobacterium elongatum]|uniref:Acetyltransferase (GNAT) family protein n=1 Tax=Acetanaerobacterium elongatum TaxID=258515 RepID=A0A1G9WHL3_9FIRM|nr:GNAT family N-acetyltransferase [Acetanaerobacterium elongatum]SDM84028.1 Acetyltransferase (GNAT) family protein [Acetanaerobacterium elongatum]
MITLSDFARKDIPCALELIKTNYEELTVSNPVLPPFGNCPPLDEFAENGLGVSAYKDGRLVGFLCWYRPWQQHFGKTAGTFSPLHAHGAIKENRGRIYSLLFEHAAQKLVRQGILSYAIALYSSDSEVVNSFFWNGFGLRCVDAIRPMEELSVASCTDYVFRELVQTEKLKAFHLKNALVEHLNASPMFIPLPPFTEAQFLEMFDDSRFFVAEDNGDVFAFLEVACDGESFVGEDASMMNICGAYMQKPYRGTGIYTQLLNHTIKTLKSEGYTRLGVDCESFNPTARGFWLKHFTPYVFSVTRRIDERITG